MQKEKQLTIVQMLPDLDEGGVEAETVETAAYLSKNGHRSMVISAGGRMVSALEKAGSRHVSWRHIGEKSPRCLTYLIPLRRLLLREQVDVLHLRSRLPAWIGFLAEYLLLATSILLMTAESTLQRLVSIILLALCLQPLIKTSIGVLLGVRYSYVYLWYFEPRFKMRFGTYHRLERWKKLALQLSGSVGTPIALLVGWRVLVDEPLLAALCLAGALAAAIMQMAAFAAAWLGVRKLGPFLLTNLTTPALLAKEWKER
jgi:hypothetical protein